MVEQYLKCFKAPQSEEIMVLISCMAGAKCCMFMVALTCKHCTPVYVVEAEFCLRRSLLSAMSHQSLGDLNTRLNDEA